MAKRPAAVMAEAGRRWPLVLIASGVITLLGGLSLFAYDRTYQQQTIVLFVSGVLIVLGCWGVVRRAIARASLRSEQD